jgi:hypothetical protein
MSIDRMRYHPYSPDIILLSLSSGTRSWRTCFMCR